MKRLVFLILLSLSIYFAGCGGDDNGTEPEPEPAKARLVVDTTVTAPNLTDVDEAVWSQVAETKAKIGHKETDYGKNIVIGVQEVSLKAIKKNGKLYIRAEWHDPSANLTADVIRCSSDESNTWEQATFTGQDVFGIIFDAQNNGDEKANCATMCHLPLMKTTGGGNVDIWKWTSTSTRPTMLAEDKWLTATASDSLRDMIESSFYPKDMFLLNWAFSLPRFKHPDTIDFTGLILYKGIAINFEFSDNTSIAWPTGYQMPGYVVDSTIFNDPDRTLKSWYDVRAISEYDSSGLSAADYTWTVVFERALHTGNADDVDFSSLDSIQVTIAATHNARIDSHSNHSGSEPFWIILKP